MNRYLIVRFGDNDFSRAWRLACEKFISWGIKGNPPASIVASYLTAYLRAAATLENNRPDMIGSEYAKLTVYGDDSYLTIDEEFITYSQDLEELHHDTPGDKSSIWENGEVAIIDLETREVEIV